MKVGLILAGGEGRRFGGDKLIVLTDGRPAVTRISDVLRAAGAELVYVATRGEQRCKIYTNIANLDGCIYDPDWLACGGPAAALAGLETLQARVLLVTPGDMPWITPDVLIRLEAFMEQTEAEAALPMHSGGFLETLVATIRWSLVERLPEILVQLCRLRGELRASDPYRASTRLTLVGSGLLTWNPIVFSHINTRERLQTREPKNNLGPKDILVTEPHLDPFASRDQLCLRLARERSEYHKLGIIHLERQAWKDFLMFCRQRVI